MSSVDGFFSSSGFLILLAEGFGVEASRGFGVYLSVRCWVMRLVNLWWGCGGCTGEGGRWSKEEEELRMFACD
jgi:hypothetical protein